VWVLALSALILAAALLAIGAQYRGPRWVVYLCKPLTTALILALACGRGGERTYTILIAVGLLCSLAGDILLMLPQDRFLAGLASFLLAHIVYSGAFIIAAQRPWTGTSLLTLIPLLAFGLVALLGLRPHLDSSLVPVLCYMLVILFMAWRAIEYARQYPEPGPVLAAAGAMVFVISDTALAYNRFARPFRTAQALVLGTYFAAQWLIALS
jgi:uncharacterized membrane protein YhhN